MRVAVTGASGQVGTLLRERLGGRADVVALDRGEDWVAGAAGAGAVVHLAGTLQPRRGETYESANVETTRAALAAAREAGAGRIAFLSYVGAAADSPNAYLRAKAEAERLLLESGLPATIFRCLHIYGPPERPGPTVAAFLASGGHVTVPGSGRQRIAPLYVGDVVAALADAALRPDPAVGVLELGGPEEMSMDEFVDALNGGAARIRHIPPRIARIAARLSPSLTPALIDLLLRDNVTASPPDAVAERFGFVPTRLEAVWSRSSPPRRTSSGPSGPTR